MNFQEKFDGFGSIASSLIDDLDDIDSLPGDMIVTSKNIRSKLMLFRSLSMRAGGNPSAEEMAEIRHLVVEITNSIDALF